MSLRSTSYAPTGCSASFRLRFQLCPDKSPRQVLGGDILLKNGDRLTGRLVKIEEGKLTLATDYAGDIQVEWSQVSCFSTDQEHEFGLSDSATVRGKARCIGEGLIEIRQADADSGRRLVLSDLTAVNPPPKVRYKGNLTAGGSASSGNTDSRALYGAGRLEVRAEEQRATVSAKGNYTESEDTVTASNASGSAKYDYKNRPAPGKESGDLRYMLGLGYSFSN